MVEETTAPKEEVAGEESAAQESETQKTDETQKDSGKVPRTVMNEKMEKKNQQITEKDTEIAELKAKNAELTPLADDAEKHQNFLRRYPHKREEMVNFYTDNLNPSAVPNQTQKPVLDAEAQASLEYDPVFKSQKEGFKQVDNRLVQTDQNIKSVSNRMEEAIFRIDIEQAMNSKNITNEAVRKDLTNTIHGKIIGNNDQNWQENLGRYIDERRKELYEPIEKDVVDTISKEAEAAEKAQEESVALPPSAGSGPVAVNIPDGLAKNEEEISNMTSDEFAEHMKSVERVTPFIAKTEK